MQFIIFIQQMDDDNNFIKFLPKADDNSSKLYKPLEHQTRLPPS